MDPAEGVAAEPRRDPEAVGLAGVLSSMSWEDVLLGSSVVALVVFVLLLFRDD